MRDQRSDRTQEGGGTMKSFLKKFGEWSRIIISNGGRNRKRSTAQRITEWAVQADENAGSQLYSIVKMAKRRKRGSTRIDRSIRILSIEKPWLIEYRQSTVCVKRTYGAEKLSFYNRKLLIIVEIVLSFVL